MVDQPFIIFLSTIQKLPERYIGIPCALLLKELQGIIKADDKIIVHSDIYNRLQRDDLKDVFIRTIHGIEEG